MKAIFILVLAFCQGCVSASVAVRQPAGQPRVSPEVEARVDFARR